MYYNTIPTSSSSPSQSSLPGRRRLMSQLVVALAIFTMSLLPVATASHSPSTSDCTSTSNTHQHCPPCPSILASFVSFLSSLVKPILGLTFLVVSFFVTLKPSSTTAVAVRHIAQYYFKLGVTVSCVAIASAFGCCFAFLSHWLPRALRLNNLTIPANINHWTAQCFAILAGPLLNVKVEVLGKEHLEGVRPCVFICNHQSSLDLLTMASIFPKRTIVMAKKSLSYYPILGMYMRLAKNVFVDRSNRRSAIETLAQVSAYMHQEKVGLYIYPEGTRSHQTTHDMLPFKKGAFHLAVQGQIPLIPVVFSTYAPEDDKDEDIVIRQADKLAGKGRVVYSSRLRRFEGGLIKVKVLPPISTTGLTVQDIPNLINETRQKMIDTLREISTSGGDRSMINGTKTSFPNNNSSLNSDFKRDEEYKDLPTASGSEGSEEELFVDEGHMKGLRQRKK